MLVSSVKTPGGSEKVWFGWSVVMRGKVPRGWNSAGPPRASQRARERREVRILVAGEEGGKGAFMVA